MLKRAGHLHNINDELPQRVHGCFASRCFACPEVGFNLPPGWEETPDDQKYAPFFFLYCTHPSNEILISDTLLRCFYQQMAIFGLS